jgi:hypothetical protein
VERRLRRAVERRRETARPHRPATLANTTGADFPQAEIP